MSTCPPRLPPPLPPIGPTDLIERITGMELPAFERVWNDLEMRIPFEADFRQPQPAWSDVNAWLPFVADRAMPFGRREFKIHHRGVIISMSRIEVLIDGRPLPFWVAADRRRGRAIARRLNPDGRPIMHLDACECSPAMIDGTHGGPHLVHDLVRGKVEIVPHKINCKIARYPTCGCKKLGLTA